MDIGDIHITENYDCNGNTVIDIFYNDSEYTFHIDPNIMAQAWQIAESGNYHLIKPRSNWGIKIYDHIISSDYNNITLISILLCALK
jgi:hypothetical protein